MNSYFLMNLWPDLRAFGTCGSLSKGALANMLGNILVLDALLLFWNQINLNNTEWSPLGKQLHVE